MFSNRSLIFNSLKRQGCGFLKSTRTYASSPVPRKRSSGPRLRYLFYVFLLSSAALYYTGQRVETKKIKTSFNEREFEEYEKETGLKRRHKLIADSKFKFYVLPYVSDSKVVNELVSTLEKNDKTRQVKVIDPEELVAREKEDESKKYCFLLQDLDAARRPLPKGLITSIIKEEIAFYQNTRNGTFDTTFIITNYPQSTDEAIKFENEVCDIQKCFHVQTSSTLSDYEARIIDNVFGYFDTVGKAKTLTKKTIKDAFKD
ncbi:uncharacterized protein RJT21DRAFT_31074 [Scheffersomyces amazonensis]|uniref:uncharacterized protein n=1 Tax=Scheffersomyces amazonensis TaxID=1078765 RepID=UPI00315DAB8E